MMGLDRGIPAVATFDLARGQLAEHALPRPVRPLARSLDRRRPERGGLEPVRDPGTPGRDALVEEVAEERLGPGRVRGVVVEEPADDRIDRERLGEHRDRRGAIRPVRDAHSAHANGVAQPASEVRLIAASVAAMPVSADSERAAIVASASSPKRSSKNVRPAGRKSHDSVTSVPPSTGTNV